MKFEFDNGENGVDTSQIFSINAAFDDSESIQENLLGPTKWRSSFQFFFAQPQLW